MADFVATAETEIHASPAQVWAALTDPEVIKRYMFGSQVESDSLVYELRASGDKTHLTRSQDKNSSEEQARQAQALWETMLRGLKEVVEAS